MREIPFNWNCPYCGQSTTIAGTNYDWNTQSFDVTASSGTDLTLKTEVICCPNPDCEKKTINSELWKNGWRQMVGSRKWEATSRLNKWTLLPRSSAKPIPDFVPEEIRNNYREACLILHDSPKASAAMSRRCLQGIVRDFWDIPNGKRGNLGAEISFIEDKVDPDVFASIKAVREVGDIGAHMDKSVDTIVDIEPEEAQLLVELIETLISDWYVVRHKRSLRNSRLQETIEQKRKEKKAAKEASKSKE